MNGRRNQIIPVIAVLILVLAWWMRSAEAPPVAEMRPARAPIPGDHLTENLTNRIEEAVKESGGSTRLPIRAYGVVAGRLVGEQDWLRAMPSDTDRWAALEAILGASGDVMLVMGERLIRLGDALVAGDFGYAGLQLDKMADAYRLYLVSHPHLEGELTGWPELRAAVEAKDRTGSLMAFETVRTGCMSCHDSVGNGFVNQQRAFTETAPRQGEGTP